MSRQRLLMNGKPWTRGDRWRRWGAETALWRKGSENPVRGGTEGDVSDPGHKATRNPAILIVEDSHGVMEVKRTCELNFSH
jgi:hypothetical protein